jgi:Ca2+-binding EF-hand superfamily protein
VGGVCVAYAGIQLPRVLQVEALVRSADVNLDGQISREEFLSVMKLTELQAEPQAELQA